MNKTSDTNARKTFNLDWYQIRQIQVLTGESSKPKPFADVLKMS